MLKKMKKRYLLGVFLLSCFIAKGQDSTIKSSVKNVEAKVDSVLALMTLEEKVGQLVQYNGSWDLTGPASEMNNKQKEENLKAGKVGAMLNVLSVEATKEAQKLVMENSRLKILGIMSFSLLQRRCPSFLNITGQTQSVSSTQHRLRHLLEAVHTLLNK